MLTLDEAIKHCEEVAEKQEITAKSYLMETDKTKADGILRVYDYDEYESCMKCASEHRQLAEWLKELKARRRIDKLDHIILMTAQYQMPEDLEQMRNEIKELEKFVEEANADV